MTHKMTSYLNSQKRHHAVEECIEAFFKYLTESDEYESEHRKTYLAKMKGLKNRNQVEQIDTMAMKNYLAGARSIVNLNPPVSASSLLENAVYHSSDTEALLSAVHHRHDRSGISSFSPVLFACLSFFCGPSAESVLPGPASVPLCQALPERL